MKKAIWISLLLFGILIEACDTNTYSEIEQDTTSNTDNGTGNNTDNGTNTDTGTGTAKITYTNDIQSIINANCTSCHNSSMESPSLTTYTQVKNATSSGKLLCTIQASGCKVMPPSGKMSQANIDLILLWKSQGYLQ